MNFTYGETEAYKLLSKEAILKSRISSLSLALTTTPCFMWLHHLNLFTLMIFISKNKM